MAFKAAAPGLKGGAELSHTIANTVLLTTLTGGSKHLCLTTARERWLAMRNLQAFLVEVT